jgi:hypothetical protein
MADEYPYRCCKCGEAAWVSVHGQDYCHDCYDKLRGRDAPIQLNTLAFKSFP